MKKYLWHLTKEPTRILVGMLNDPAQKQLGPPTQSEHPSTGQSSGPGLLLSQGLGSIGLGTSILS